MCKKLTAERARERIQHLQLWQQQRGLTIREEEYLEALEGYLPLLEQRESRYSRDCTAPCSTSAQYESLSLARAGVKL